MTARLPRILDVPPDAVAHHLVTLPSWDPRRTEESPNGCPCVRLTALARRKHGLRRVVFEAPTEAEALAALCAEGIAW